MQFDWTRWIVRTAVAISLALLTGCGESAAPAVAASGDLATWTAYGSLPGGSHYSTASQITRENVHGLELAWEHRSGDIRQPRAASEGGPPMTASGFQATPIVIDDTLYYCSPFNKVFALDAETGVVRPTYGQSSRSTKNAASSSSPPATPIRITLAGTATVSTTIRVLWSR